jgi:hypothetical protein
MPSCPIQGGSKEAEREKVHMTKPWAVFCRNLMYWLQNSPFSQQNFRRIVQHEAATFIECFSELNQRFLQVLDCLRPIV